MDLPHDFGFPMAVTKRDLFVVPLLADTNRVVPDGEVSLKTRSPTQVCWLARYGSGGVHWAGSWSGGFFAMAL